MAEFRGRTESSSFLPTTDDAEAYAIVADWIASNMNTKDDPAALAAFNRCVERKREIESSPFGCCARISSGSVERIVETFYFT